MNLSREDVEDILKVLDSTAYDELHLETDRFALRLRREAGGWTEEHEALGEAKLVAGQPGTDQARSEQSSHRETANQEQRQGLQAVRAPLPGVFYRAPKPGEPPFVEVGDHVEPETVVAILETMKLMNPVRAGAAGTVVEFSIDNNEAAEQGAVLLWLAPDAADAAPDAP